jgi:hypothetical protein
MKMEQLRLFNEKGDFNSRRFESDENREMFSKLAASVDEAFNLMNNIDITSFDSTTRANMLNNLVVDCVQKNCANKQFCFYKSLSNTRRSYAIFNDEYIFLFKKYPVSNVQTNQDTLIKSQELDKHVIFVVYCVDEFWSSVSKVELQYFSSPQNMTYSYDITDLMGTNTTRSIQTIPNELKPNITIRKELIKTKKAE